MNRNKKLLGYFSKKARIYEKESKEWNYNVPEEFFKFISQYLEDHTRVLDVGVGTGQSSEPFIKRGKELYGIDFSREMIEEASKYRFKDLKVKDISLGLPYHDNSFDVVISVSTCNLYKNIEGLIKEMIRVTKERGIVGFTVEKQEKKQPKKWFAKEAKLYGYRHSREDITNILRSLDAKLMGETAIIAYRLRPPAYKERDIVYEAYALRKI